MHYIGESADESLRQRQRQLQALAAQLTISEENTRRAIASDLITGSKNTPDLQEIIDITEKVMTENKALIFELIP